MTLFERYRLHPVHAVSANAGVLTGATFQPEGFHHKPSHHDAHRAHHMCAIDVILPVNYVGEPAYCGGLYTGCKLFGHSKRIHKWSLARVFGRTHRYSPPLEIGTENNVSQPERNLNRVPLHGHVKFGEAA